MAGLLEIVKHVEIQDKALVEQLLRYVEREAAIGTVSALAKLDSRRLGTALQHVESRKPFFALDDRSRTALVEKILTIARRITEERKQQQEKRRSRPPVSLEDFANVVRPPADLQQAWKNAGIRELADLHSPKAVKILLDQNLPLAERRKLLSLTNLSLASGNLKLSDRLYKSGISSLARLARAPKRRLVKILSAANLNEDDFADAFEAQQRARLIHQQSQNFAIGQASAPYNFGPPSAHYDFQPDLDKVPDLGGLLDLRFDPVDETTSCGTCSECQNVFSPLAYLFDLLDFIKDQWDTTAGTLERVLLQKIQDLTCETANAPTTQIRIAIQVLEKFIGGQILRNDAGWRNRFKQTGDSLVQLFSNTRQLTPAVTTVAELAGDARFSGDQPVQLFVAALSAATPALNEVDAIENSLRDLEVAHIDASFPLPPEPVNPTEDETLAYLIERSLQEQNRDVEKQQFEKQLAQIIESVYVEYRKLLIEKTQKPTAELENLLFIHLTGAPCHRTTALTQLILSLQAFVLAVRTGEIISLQQTERLAPIIGSRDFSDFDEETWIWLETFAQWSSAMYVFLYPENIMGLPSLRTPMSALFASTMESLAVSSSAGMVDSALQRFDDELRSFRQLRLLSAHVVKEKLYIFASPNSSAIWMNTIDHERKISEGWRVMFEGDRRLLPWDVAPHYGGEQVRFVSAFHHRATDAWGSFDGVRLKWLNLDGTQESGPEIQPIENEHYSGGLALGIQRQSNQLVTYVKWVSGAGGGSLTYLKDFLNADGTMGMRHAQPTNDIFGTDETLVGDLEFRVGNFRRDSVTITRVASNQAVTFDVEYPDFGPANQATPKYALADNPDSTQTYLVRMPASSYPGVSAYAPIDLQGMAFGNEWHALSTTFENVESAMADLGSSNGELPLALDNIYVEERYLHFPLLAAWSLNSSGDYANAHDWLLRLYNPFHSPHTEVFPFSRFFRGGFERSEEWLGDPLNPHVIARHRSGVYLRNVILLMVKNLLNWADHEFTLNHTESRHRAEELYRLAKQILEAPALANPCEEGLRTIDFEVGQRFGIRGRSLFYGLDDLSESPSGRRTIEELLALVRVEKSINTIRLKGQKIIDIAARNSRKATVSDLTDLRQRFLEKAEARVIAANPSLVQKPRTDPFLGRWVVSLDDGRSSQSMMLQINRGKDGKLKGTLQSQPLDDIKIDQASKAIEFRQFSRNLNFKGTLQNGRISGDATSVTGRITKQLTFLRQIEDAVIVGRSDDLNVPDITLEPITISLCVPVNPLLASFDSHISNALLALDQCRLISGELQPATRLPAGYLEDSTPTLVNLLGGSESSAIASEQPRYRFGYLHEQARQRAALAKQLGDALAGALRERDQASYDRLLAENARAFAGANRDLKELVRAESRDARTIATTQLRRAESNQIFWNDRIANNPGGMSKAELDALGMLSLSGWLQMSAAIVSFVTALPAALAAGAGASLSAASAAGTVGSGGTAAPIAVPGWILGNLGIIAGAAAGGQQIAGGLGSLAGAFGTWANEQLTRASFERRWEEWNLQNTLANFDQQIAQQQTTLADDRVRISEKDLEIAGLQYLHAQRVYEFLQNKTLNKELYEWMVAVLIEQYRAVMQSATSVAQLAQRALEFEWQSPVTIVKGDYWTVDAPSLREDQKGYGLLGAERLLTDLNRLADFRLSTDKRRLQLSKTISLAQRLPAEFVRFRQTGRVEFDTLIDWFDEDFPGHYLRLIKSVRVSVLALVPPVDGLHATLNNVGASTVVFPDRPPQRSLRTFGESIALDSAYNESGLFVLDYNDPMLLPFEGLGVETHWLFELPRDSNRFNFDTIADVLFTFEYTAQADETYAERVRQRLGTVRSTTSMLSLRTSFPDEWYHLQNPLDATQPQIVTFNIPRNFFAPNLDNLILKHLTLVLAPAQSASISELRSSWPQNAITITVGGIDLNISGNAIDQLNGTITTMQPGLPGNALFTDPTFDGQNVVPFGDWQVRIAPELYTVDSNNARKLDLLADLLIVPTVEGQRI